MRSIFFIDVFVIVFVLMADQVGMTTIPMYLFTGIRFTIGDVLFNPFMLAVVTLVLMLIILVLKKKTYDFWYRYLKFAAPILLFLTTLISIGAHHNPAGQWQDIFDIPALILLYTIFTIGSLVQIYRGYRH